MNHAQNDDYNGFRKQRIKQAFAPPQYPFPIRCSFAKRRLQRMQKATDKAGVRSTAVSVPLPIRCSFAKRRLQRIQKATDKAGVRSTAVSFPYPL
jgi:hypothetical protein